MRWVVESTYEFIWNFEEQVRRMGGSAVVSRAPAAQNSFGRDHGARP